MNQSHQTSLDFPKIRGKRNKEILQVISTVLSAHGRITQKDLKGIMAALMGDNNRHLPIKTHRRLSHVLTLLKDWYGVDTVVPAVPIPPARQSILPESAEEFSWVDGSNLLEQTFWDEWLASSLDTKGYSFEDRYESLVFAFAFSLAADISLHAVQIADLMAKLCWDDIIDNGKSLKLKVHPNDRLDRYCHIGIPNPTRLIIHRLVKLGQQKGSDPSFIFPSGSELKFKKKKAKINRILSSKYLSLLELARKEGPDLPFPPTWTDFTRVSYLIGFDAGIEPFIISALQRYPLPVSHPIESPVWIYGMRRPHHASLNTLPFASNKTPVRQVAFKSTDFGKNKKETKHHSDWCGESKTILKRLVIKLKASTRKKIASEIQVNKACKLINDSLNEANQLAPGNKSALHLALYWIRDYITKNQSISAKTVGDYFGRAFYNGLLTFSDSNDLTLWDAEDHELAIEATLSLPNLSPSYKRKIITVYKMVYRYALENGFAKGVSITFIADEWIGSSTRSEIIAMHHFDIFIRLKAETGNREGITVAVTAILAFYGGLRAGETNQLSLKDVIALDGELYIEILSGKSPAARRRVPLHLLAPPYLCKIVEDYWLMRLNEFRRSEFHRTPPLRNIPLFGPEKSRKGYTRKSLIDVTIAELKCNFGEKVVYHSLRHSMSSHLLLRWYAGRYPDFLNVLSEKHHPVFSGECQENLISYFTSETVDLIPDHNASDLVKVSKVVGHRGQETLFSTYIHTFDAIHSHAMIRTSEIKGRSKLNGKTISALVPKMKDRHNHSKLPGRSINDICDYLELS